MLHEFNVLTDSISIGAYAFARCSILANIFIGKVTSIGAGAFMHTKLTQIFISGNGIPIPDEVFHGCSELQTVALIGTFSSVGKNAFFACSKITKLDIMPSTNSNADFQIGEAAFTGCSHILTHPMQLNDSWQ